jgi:hypothetical protein
LHLQEFFLETMMQLELGLETPDPDDSPAKAGLAMFTSFVFFGVRYLQLEVGCRWRL